MTYEKTGYEGSSALYLERDKFDDYYNDNDNDHHHHHAIPTKKTRGLPLSQQGVQKSA